MPNLATHACPNCGAPLTIPKGTATVSCQYCGNAIHIQWNRRAPPERVPPLTLYVPPRTAPLVVLLVAGALLLIGIGVFAFLHFLSSPVKRAVDTARDHNSSSVAFPMTCGANGILEIVDRVYEGAGTLVTAQANCRVKIKNSRLKGDIVVLANNTSTVEVTNSTLEGRDVGVKSESNNKIRVSDKSVIKGTSAAIEAGVNTELALVESRFEGHEVGILADKNVEGAIRRCHVQAQRYAIKSDVNLKLSSIDSTFRAESAAFYPSTNFQLEAQGGLIQGNEAAILVKAFLPTIRLSGGALVETKGTAIEAEANLKLFMDDATINAERIGVVAGSNAYLDMRNKSKIHGGQIGLRLTFNAEISMRNATIQGGRHGICAEFNMALSAEGATIEAKADALRLASQPRRFAVGSSQIVGNKNYAAKDCAL